MIISSLSYGQNVYNFTKSEQTYTDLVSAVSINNGQVWDFDEFGPFNIPFDFNIAGKTFNRFVFSDDNFILLTPDANPENDTDMGMYYVLLSGAFLQDRTYSSDVSSSPISYKIEGTEGHHILKLEVRNAGFETAQNLGFEEDHFYVNEQIWLYENDKAIEFRYGSNNVTSIDYMPFSEVLTGLEGDEFAFILTGSTIAPDYDEFTLDNPPGDDAAISLDAYPVAGTVYRFAPAVTSGTNNTKAHSFTLYPNPANELLYLTTNTPQTYDVYNLLGAKVLSGDTIAGTTSINVASLQNGVYVMKSGNASHKFIKK